MKGLFWWWCDEWCNNFNFKTYFITLVLKEGEKELQPEEELVFTQFPYCYNSTRTKDFVNINSRVKMRQV